MDVETKKQRIKVIELKVIETIHEVHMYFYITRL